MKSLLFIIIVCFNYCSTLPSDEVLHLPGLTFNATFRQYSGYLDVGSGRHYHYWFVESQSKPETDPLILWLNGGPGCSSLGGFWTENGPFRVENDGKSVVADQNSWNTLANVLYFESPIGVGYSFSDNETFHNNDDSTADDNYSALQKFFEKFPKFTKNAFYITGESYAGIYIPMLALKIYTNKSNINLKGVAIGNGLLDSELNDNSRVNLVYHHGLIDNSQWNFLVHKCCHCKNGIQECNFSNESSDYCAPALELRQNIIDNKINVYNIYSDCDPLLGISADSPYYTSLKTYFGINFTQIKNRAQSLSTESKPQCLSQSFASYLNLAEVRKALHIPDHLNKWKQCQLVNYRKQYFSMKTQIKELVEKYKIPKFIVFNGDIDMVCNFLGGQQFVDGLGFKLLDVYKKWTVGQRTAGFIKKYNGITFMTVRNAGHMVPTDQPEAALAIIKELLKI